MISWSHLTRPPGGICGWWVHAEKISRVFVCTREPGHEMPHTADDGTWFEGCGLPPSEYPW